MGKEMDIDKDRYYMAMALEEAKKGLGFTSPNPMVGSVIVKDGSIISTGYHKRVGADHAELDAIKNAGNIDKLKGATLYVNLEPCCHYGRTPPCTEAIINNGIKEVVIGNVDVDQRVAGKGIDILTRAGIKVQTGVLSDEDYKLNSIYYFFKKNKRPYIVLKSALTLDGKIGTRTGDSKWISNEDCRNIVHRLRARIKSIAIGKNTILTDKPKLNCRLEGFEQKPVDKLIFTSKEEPQLIKSFAKNNGKNFFIGKEMSSDKDKFLQYCIDNEIDSILIEGGGEIYSWFIDNRLVDRILLFYKPSFLGNDGIALYNGRKHISICELTEFNLVSTTKIENNIMIDLSIGEPICLLV